MSLSEKEQNLPQGNGDFYSREDVKEFILNCLADGWDKQCDSRNDEEFNQGIQFMKETIKNYAGEKLCE